MALHRSTATLRTLLTSPDSLFEARLPRGNVAGRIVGLVALGHAIVLLGGFLLFALQLALLSPNVSTTEALRAFFAQAFLPGLAFSLLVVLNWLVVSAVLHVFAKLRHGEGTFGDTLFVVGWSAPIALLLPVAIVAGLVISLGSAGSPEAFLGAPALRGALEGVSLLATLVVLCWQGYVWIAGLQRTHGLSTDGAVFSVVLTVAVGALLTVAGG